MEETEQELQEQQTTEETTETESENTDSEDDNSVYVGKKPFMNYVTSVVMQFTTKRADEVVIKARGKFISRAVDVAEVAGKRFLEGAVGVKNIDIDSEEFTKDNGDNIRVSSMEITLEKQGELPEDA